MRSLIFKSRGQQTVEARLGEPVEAFVRRRYEVEGQSQEAIATELGIDQSTLSRWMRDFGIETRIFGRRPAA